MFVANIYMDIYFWRWVRWMNFDNFADKMKTVNGTFGDVGGCNEWAAFFSTYTLLIIALLNKFKRKSINISLKILAIANIIVLLFTFSRGGYAALIAGITYLLIKARKYAYILLLLALPLCYTVVLPEAVVERIQMSFEKNDLGVAADQDIESRVFMWKEAVSMIKKAPVFGHGLLSFRYSHWRNPHNQHLNIFVQGGLIGYLFFIWLFIASFRDSNHLAQTGKNEFSRSFGVGMCAMTVSLFIGNLFGDRWSYYVLTGYYWILNGIVLVLINQSASSTSESESLTL
ncbi:hypothetical protein DGMP_01240 [Desulfomarina profundi]|uniref:O-antigen ligase-related domain-containing protein n=1 Tax=Desulfomarina profundi TaxID=2772557 RepID=A0A8D5FEX8_9BACT|nr:hypothetical protein DGMP_01240 [Desulfomarina profundi]